MVHLIADRERMKQIPRSITTLEIIIAQTQNSAVLMVNVFHKDGFATEIKIAKMDLTRHVTAQDNAFLTTLNVAMEHAFQSLGYVMEK